MGFRARITVLRSSDLRYLGSQYLRFEISESARYRSRPISENGQWVLMHGHASVGHATREPPLLKSNGRPTNQAAKRKRSLAYGAIDAGQFVSSLRRASSCSLRRFKMAECICETRLSDKSRVRPISFIVISS